MDYLIDSSFQGVNRLFVLSSQNNLVRAGHTRNVPVTAEAKDYNFTIDGLFDNQPVKNNLRTNDHNQKTKTGQGDDYTNDCLLNYIYLKKYHKMIEMD